MIAYIDSVVLEEIEDRKSWLNEMEKLGKAEPYRKKISNEIKLVRLKTINNC
jgi:hypothetical protein